jgi:hypothetical protein
MLEVNVMNRRVFDRAVPDQNVVDSRTNLIRLDPDTACRIPLRVAIDEERSLLCGCEACGEVDGGRRFSNTALLVRNRYDTSHYL